MFGGESGLCIVLTSLAVHGNIDGLEVTWKSVKGA
jgi:hypothetical protein